MRICLVHQPNGKWARFSSVVDHFTAFDMTLEQGLWMFKAETGITMKPQDALDVMKDHPDLFEDVMKSVKEVHGEEQEQLFRKLMTEPGNGNVKVSLECAPWFREIDWDTDPMIQMRIEMEAILAETNTEWRCPCGGMGSVAKKITEVICPYCKTKIVIA